MLRTSVWLWGSTGLLALSCLPLSAQALPAGGNVVAGEAVINPVSENYLEINQSSDRAILHWDSFNLGPGHQVHFSQPSVDAATLNRVTGDTPSNIAGQITAVGNIMLVNPNGILFTETAQIDVGGLLGTSLLVDEVGFMGGQPLSLQAGQDTPGSVINRGQITVRDAGYAALVAPHVANQGVIRARLGRVDLASGSQATVDFYGDGLISLAVDPALVHDPEILALIENGGEIIADGGQVWLSAEAGAAIVDYVINTDGIIQARQVENQDGRIVLRGGQGRMRVAGQLEATGGTLDIAGTELFIDSEVGTPRGVGPGAADMTVALNLGHEAAPGSLDISEDGFLRVRELSLDSSLQSGDQTPITIANARADGLHGDQLTLNTRFQLEGYGFNPSSVVNVNPGGSIQAGVNAVEDGGLVSIAPGLFTEGSTITINNRNLTLRGAGPGADANTNTLVSGEGQYRVFSVNNGSNVTFEQLRIQAGNAQGNDGGGIFVGDANNVTVRNSTLTGNQARDGGGIYGRFSTVTIENSLLSDNNSSFGGAIYNWGGTFTVDQSTLSNNTSGSGGGIFSNISGAETVIRNSTISGNAANTGGGVYTRRGLVVIQDSTITENSAPAGNGGGVASRGITEDNTFTRVSNTIISNNSDSDVDIVDGDISNNTFVSLGHNLVGSGNGINNFSADTNDIISTNPGLGPLADNGGPTPTHALLAESPAVNAGSTSAATDQRGLPRGDTPDIGAFEVQPISPEEPQPEDPRPEEPQPGDPQPGDPLPDPSQPSGTADQVRQAAASVLTQGTEEILLWCQDPEALPEILEIEGEDVDATAWCGISGQNAHYSDQLPRLLPDL
ncbi:choice-of-anchor Q domain-containing protein [Nodosilinea sp. P-1105]|uniref:two-partner secretion domain-containing protein n=1 Tax=Nodosilinea sp. P-1105 TaxID=2546229 RepID=UPI00146A2904|nr:choice-of-anchor Q domain-containing protein [Nodosilinea sp. P-1105]